MVTPSWAQAPAAPRTLWSFLGIPQGTQKVRDALSNRSGNNPDAERTPALKSIADPSNLTTGESGGPIQVAAKVKQDQDLAPQKIKAIKYLATVGCGCQPGVREALLKALDDCTEEVRYEAAIALCKAAGNHCERCGGTCCNAAVMTKLQDKATGTDKDNPGCYKESSERVRAAAQNALNACKNKLPASPATTIPVEPGPKIENSPESPTPAVKPLSPEGLKPIPPPPATTPTPTPKATISPRTLPGAAPGTPPVVRPLPSSDSQARISPSNTVLPLSVVSAEETVEPVRLRIVIGDDKTR